MIGIHSNPKYTNYRDPCGSTEETRLVERRGGYPGLGVKLWQS